MPATILIIEDDASVRQGLARVLEDAGYQVSVAGTCPQGLEQFRAQPVDLVLMNLDMPETSSFQVMLKLTRMFLHVKVIAMSEYSVDGRQKARLLGARQTFPKPLDLTALLHGIRYELQH